MIENVIKVKTRREFIDLLRKIFIPSCLKKFGSTEGFDIGYAINNWTEFWITNEDGSITSVEIEAES